MSESGARASSQSVAHPSTNRRCTVPTSKSPDQGMTSAHRKPSSRRTSVERSHTISVYTPLLPFRYICPRGLTCPNTYDADHALSQVITAWNDLVEFQHFRSEGEIHAPPSRLLYTSLWDSSRAAPPYLVHQSQRHSSRPLLLPPPNSVCWSQRYSRRPPSFLTWYI